MRIAISVAVLLLAACGMAAAADMVRIPVRKAPVEPSVLLGWSGLYLGLNVGGAAANGRSRFDVAGATFASVNNPLEGWLAGAQAGFNWQRGAAVFGLEVDAQTSRLAGTLTAPCPPGLCALPLTATYGQHVPWFGTARGRLGYAAASWLIYATGGFAYARLDTDAFAAAGPLVAAFGRDETRGGWTVGGGIEVAFAPHWSAKLEYLHLDYGRVASIWTFTGLPAITDDAALTMNVVRAGVNYRF
jgi:outer membrane immunogenic protein